MDSLKQINPMIGETKFLILCSDIARESGGDHRVTWFVL